MAEVGNRNQSLRPNYNLKRLVFLAVAILSGITVILFIDQQVGSKWSLKKAGASSEYTGDLPEMRRHRKLRILQSIGDDYLVLPSGQFPLDETRASLIDFAKRLDLSPEWVPVDSLDELLPALIKGQGDIFIDGLPLSVKDLPNVSLSLPREALEIKLLTSGGPSVTSDSGPMPKMDFSSLGNASILLEARGSESRLLNVIRSAYPSLYVEVVPKVTQNLINTLSFGAHRFLAVESWRSGLVMKHDQNLWAAPEVTTIHVPYAAIRKDSPQLLENLNVFVQISHINKARPKVGARDLDEIKKSGIIRAALKNTPSSYILWKGEIRGLDFELAQRFAKEIGVSVVPIVVPIEDNPIDLVKEGLADIAFATPEDIYTTSRQARTEIKLSLPYRAEQQMLVARSGDAISAIDHVAGRKIAVRRSSQYWDTLKILQDRYEFNLVVSPESLSDLDILNEVAAGRFDLTATNTRLLDDELPFRSDLRSVVPLSPPRSHSLGINNSSPNLLKAANAFMETNLGGLDFTLMEKRYFGSPGWAIRKEPVEDKIIKRSEPYLAEIKALGIKYGIDWRFILSQVAEESAFQPKLTSFGGSVGLMQMLPESASRMGAKDPSDPAESLRAGVGYFNWLVRRISGTGMNDKEEILLLALAAYKAGLGHLIDARELAKSQGLSSDQWFGNIEKAMLLLEYPENYQTTGAGYCRGREVVRYVQAVNSRYEQLKLDLPEMSPSS